MGGDDQLQHGVHDGLDRVVSTERFAPFLDAVEGDTDLALQLYVWNRDLSVAVLADVAVIEVALRNSMHSAAVRAWGPHWYSNLEVPLDDRSASQLKRAWSNLPRSVQNRALDDDVPGRLVAQCMFGFWTNLLDQGGYSGQTPRRANVRYDTLWDEAFKHAFPGGRGEARQQRLREVDALPKDRRYDQRVARLQQTVAFTREWVHSVCKVVNDLRNRVAHHEPLINGFPLNGQGGRRLTIGEGHEHCCSLARMIDRDFARWIGSNSRVPHLIAADPRRLANDHTSHERHP